MSKQKTFKDILEAEKKKVKPIAKWHLFVSGKDIPHKDKSKYSRKEKHKADPQGNQPFLYLMNTLYYSLKQTRYLNNSLVKLKYVFNYYTNPNESSKS